MKTITFETLYRAMKYYDGFKNGDDVVKLNCFMNEMYSYISEQDGFDETKYDFFLKSWRWNAQQRIIGNGQGTTKRFLNSVYRAYSMIPRPLEQSDYKNSLQQNPYPMIYFQNIGV